MGKKLLGWTQVDKSNWTTSIDGESLPARIRMLDAKTYAVYRDGKYLGGEPTLDVAKARIVENKVSEKNRVMKLWEAAHPDELPPGLQLTDAERAEYWRHHAPKATARVTGGAVPKAVGVTPVVTGRTPSANPAMSAKPKKGDSAPRGNHDAEITTMLKKGCTSEEVLRVTGWKAISMPAMAKKLGLGLRIDKSRKPFKYHAEEEK